MRHFFATVAACFTAGLLLILSIAALSFVPDWIESSASSDEKEGRTSRPQGFRILEHKTVPNTDTYTVQGVLQNSSTAAWNYPFIKLRLEQNGNVISLCEGMVSGTMQPMSRRAFQIECEDAESPEATDSSYRYEIFVDSAMRHKG